MRTLRRRSWWVWAAVVSGLTIASVAFGQMRGGMGGGPSIAGLFHPKVGYGAVYETTDTRGQISNMSMAIVGKESVGGTTAYWMEISFANPRSGGDMILKYLMAPQGSSLHVYRAIMKNPAMGVMEMPDTMMERINQTMGQNLSTSMENMGKNLGSEVISTKAGPKKCTHWQRESNGVTSDVWINDDVYPTALVKSIIKTQDGLRTTILTEEIANATTKITEEPKKMELPGMRPPGN
jgi:hypothetical protein